MKNKRGKYVDKNLREVNQQGYLVDTEGNIVDNQGRVKIGKHLLTDKDDIPKLYNYSGRQYHIKDIIGTF